MRFTDYLKTRYFLIDDLEAARVMRQVPRSSIDAAAQVLDPEAFDLLPGGHPQQAERDHRRRAARELAAQALAAANTFAYEKEKLRKAIATYHQLKGRPIRSGIAKEIKGLSVEEIEKRIDEVRGDDWYRVQAVDDERE